MKCVIWARSKWVCDMNTNVPVIPTQRSTKKTSNASCLYRNSTICPEETNSKDVKLRYDFRTWIYFLQSWTSDDLKWKQMICIEHKMKTNDDLNKKTGFSFVWHIANVLYSLWRDFVVLPSHLTLTLLFGSCSGDMTTDTTLPWTEDPIDCVSMDTKIRRRRSIVIILCCPKKRRNGALLCTTHIIYACHMKREQETKREDPTQLNGGPYRLCKHGQRNEKKHCNNNFWLS